LDSANLITRDQSFLLRCTWVFYLWCGYTVYSTLWYVILECY